MFYTGLPAYNFIQSLEQYQDVKKKERKIAIFKKHNVEIPEYLTNDSTVIVIENEIRGFE